MYTVTRTLPDGTTKTKQCAKLRDAGKHVAYCLADNCNADRKTATQAGMQLEKTGRTESHGYTFILTRNA